MEITLKQPDIEKAVRLHVERQGISLRNKNLTIDFSMGRGANGLVANLTIEDVEIPGFNEPEPTAADMPSAAVQAMVTGTNQGKVATKVAGSKPNTAEMQELKEAAKADVAVTAPIVEVNGVVEVPVTAPATLAEVIEAGIPAIATPATEAAAAEPMAEAKVAEADPTPGATDAPAPKTTTSLFG